MKINIKNEGGVGFGTRVTLDDGTDLGEKISSLNISIKPNELVLASVQFAIEGIDIDARAIVSEFHLRELAEAHGFSLVKILPLKKNG